MTKKTSKNEQTFSCDKCNYICCYNSDYKRHVNTRKHIRMTSNDIKTNENEMLHYCKCGKKYKHRQGLFSHKQICNYVEPSAIMRELNTLKENVVMQDDTTDYKAMFLEAMSQNKEFMEVIREQSNTINNMVPKIGNNNNNNTTNNNKFNLQVFLNEDCKDAINFSDFIKNIQVSYEDLENNIQLGFVNGISKIFLDNLKQLDVYDRPIHCTDVKRETIYIKDENVWTKQSDDDKLQRAIQTVSYRSMGKLTEWKQENPDYKDCNSEFSQKCLDIHRNTLAGSERQVYYPKVIHALARETIIEK